MSIARGKSSAAPGGRGADGERRGVIERNLRQIQRLEKEVEEARRERDEQAAQVPTKP